MEISIAFFRIIGPATQKLTKEHPEQTWAVGTSSECLFEQILTDGIVSNSVSELHLMIKTTSENLSEVVPTAGPCSKCVGE